jgi:hypothetical protein
LVASKCAGALPPVREAMVGIYIGGSVVVLIVVVLLVYVLF